MANQNTVLAEMAVGNKIPTTVIAVFNELIQKHVDKDGIAVIEQNEVFDSFIEKGLIPENEMPQVAFTHGWCEVGEVYRDSGWVVLYINSANEEVRADASFIFVPIGELERRRRTAKQSLASS